MSDPPAKKSKDSSTFTVLFNGNLAVGESTTSPVRRIAGFPWRIRVVRALSDNADMINYVVSLLCDASVESELWSCEASVKMSCHPRRMIIHRSRAVVWVSSGTSKYTFLSWSQLSQDVSLCTVKHTSNDTAPPILEVEISTESNGDGFTRRPTVEELSKIHDCILLVDGQKLPVNKQVLSSQSIYFNRLFFGNFKEAAQDEIEIKDVDPEDFNELLNMIYGTSTEPTTEDNAMKYLMMADIFDLKIVRDRVENFLLSTDSITLHRKMLIADQNRLDTFKKEVLSLHRVRKNVVALHNSPEFAELSTETKDILTGYAWDLLA